MCSSTNLRVQVHRWRRPSVLHSLERSRRQAFVSHTRWENLWGGADTPCHVMSCPITLCHVVPQAGTTRPIEPMPILSLASMLCLFCTSCLFPCPLFFWAFWWTDLLRVRVGVFLFFLPIGGALCLYWHRKVISCSGGIGDVNAVCKRRVIWSRGRCAWCPAHTGTHLRL